MSFLAPLGLAFASLAGVVLLLHMLKMKRRELDVSSTLLWKKTIEDLRANAPFQKLRRSLLLLLQLLAVAALALALARPVKNLAESTGRRIVILIDVSASMRAREPSGETRLDLAKAEARKIVDGLEGGDRAAVVSFDARARAHTALSESPALLRTAIDALAPSDLGTDAHEGLALAAAALRDVHGGEIVLLSDGRFGAAGEVDLGGARARYVRIGSPVENAGIVGLDVRRRVDEAGGTEVLAKVASFAPAPRRLTVTLRRPAAGGSPAALLDAKELTVAPGRAEAAVFTLPGSARGYHEVALEREGGAGDALALDDAAGFVLRAPEPAEVLLVTPGNYFLERLIAVDPELTGKSVAPAKLAGMDISGGPVVIFDRATELPRELPPQGAIFVGCAPPGRKPAREAPVKDPAIAEWDAMHPAVRFASFGEIAIAEAAPLALLPQDRVILSSDQGPLIAEVRDGRARAIVVSFDLMKSDWPLKASFPIFFRNAIRHVAGRGEGERALFRAGEPLEVEGLPREAEVAITDPRGETRRVRTDGAGRATLAEARVCGRYTVDPGAGRAGFDVAVDLLDARESDLGPADKIDLGERPVETVLAALVAPRPLWKYFAAAALALLALEWWVYNRRAYI
jgi:hypothetical protein